MPCSVFSLFRTLFFRVREDDLAFFFAGERFLAARFLGLATRFLAVDVRFREVVRFLAAERFFGLATRFLAVVVRFLEALLAVFLFLAIFSSPMGFFDDVDILF